MRQLTTEIFRLIWKIIVTIIGGIRNNFRRLNND